MAGLITALILLPLAGALFVSLSRPSSARAVAVGFTALSAIVAFLLWRNFDSAAAGLQLVERHEWIPSIGAEYLVGIDGLSLLLVVLTSLVFPFALLAQRMERGACALLLVMQAALYGTFTAQNFLLWFLFYEMSLIPGFLLIKIWGGENRDRAATKFFLYTFLGSVAMLLSFLGIYFSKGSFDFAKLTELARTGPLLGGKLGWIAFAGIFLGLAVKVPLFPFHTWLPDAYETAPVGVSMVLTGSAFPARDPGARPMAPRPRGLLYCVSVTRRLGGVRLEADGGLPLHQSSGVLHARLVRGKRRRHEAGR